MSKQPITPEGPNGFPTDLITPTRAAQLSGCCIQTIYRWIFSGKLPAWRRAGTRYLIREADVRALMVPVAARKRVELPVALSPGHYQAMENLRRAGYV